jgi:hypothetical protein
LPERPVAVRYVVVAAAACPGLGPQVVLQARFALAVRLPAVRLWAEPPIREAFRLLAAVFESAAQPRAAGLSEAVVAACRPRMAGFAAQARRLAEPEVLAQQAAPQPVAAAGLDVSAQPRAAHAAGVPEAVARGAAEEPLPEVEARVGAAVRRPEAVARAGVAEQRPEAAAQAAAVRQPAGAVLDAAVQQREVRDARAAALPSAGAFHPCPARLSLAPAAAERFVRAMQRPRIASPSERSWQAAQDEVLS